MVLALLLFRLLVAHFNAFRGTSGLFYIFEDGSGCVFFSIGRRSSRGIEIFADAVRYDKEGDCECDPNGKVEIPDRRGRSGSKGDESDSKNVRE
jgi:hypothetical protein